MTTAAREVIRQSIRDDTRALADGEIAVRATGSGDDVHRARVATRALRSNLRTFESLLDEEWVIETRAELAWIAALLGRVRDLDVLRGRLADAVAQLPERDQEMAAPLLLRLSMERQAALHPLQRALASERFDELMARLGAAADAPPTTDEADGAASGLLRPLARRRWRKLRKQLADDPSTVDELHSVRIAAKKARYAVDAIGPAASKKDRRHRKRASRLQTTLGNQRDAMAAEHWLRDQARTAQDEQAVVIGILIGLERADQRVQASG
jgi:CHAD domain-containing protein